MAKKTFVKVTGVAEARDSALKFLNTRTQDRKILDEIGSLLVFQIKARTKSSKEEYAQLPLKNVTIESRKIYSNVYDTDQFSDPKRSNLTLTGQLLNSIKHRISATTSDIILFLSNNRRNRVVPDSLIKEYYNSIIDKDHNSTNSKRKNPKTKDILTALFLLKNSKDKNNNEIKDDLESQGRKFFFMSAKLKVQLEKNITAEIRRQLTLFNKIKRKLSL